MTQAPTTVAAEIRAALARERRSLRWLSEQTDIPSATLSRKVNGHVAFTVGDLVVICQALNVSAADMVALVETSAA